MSEQTFETCGCDFDLDRTCMVRSDCSRPALEAENARLRLEREEIEGTLVRTADKLDDLRANYNLAIEERMKALGEIEALEAELVNLDQWNKEAGVAIAEGEELIRELKAAHDEAVRKIRERLDRDGGYRGVGRMYYDDGLRFALAALSVKEVPDGK